MELEGKVILITGAASKRGMGRATAKLLASLGAKVVVTDRAPQGRDDTIQNFVQELRQNGCDALGIAMDVTRQEEIHACVEKVLHHYQRVDVLINNAGTPAGVGPFEKLKDAQWRNSFEVHLFGAVNLIRAILPTMKKQKEGLILNNASTLGLGGMPDFSAYGASKFAVVGLTKHLAAEFGPLGIRVNCVCPGMIDTAMSDLEVNQYMEAYAVDRDEAIQALSEYVPLGRYGKPEEVASVLAFLCGEGASYLSGAAIPISGALMPGV